LISIQKRIRKMTLSKWNEVSTHSRLTVRLLFPCAVLLLAGCSTTQQNIAPAAGRTTAQEALRPYYAALDAKLPTAPPNPALAADTVITRFAFGSCQNENRDMKFWDVIAAQKPQAFLLIGDNVYGDIRPTNGADIPTLIASYKKLNARAEYDRFRRNIPMMTLWDDHDYGANDAGGAFAFKEWAEKVYETYWSSSDEVKSRPGVYESRIIGPAGKRVQFIILDSRFFRSDLATMPYRDPGPSLGWYIPDTDPNATVLGKAQWDWLAQEMAKPAEIRFIISSTQVITDAHNFEGWTNFPKERERLYALLAEKHVNNAIFLTGDRHSGGFYRTSAPGLSSPLWEFTSSSLNFAFGKGDGGEKEPDPRRIGGLWGIPNFGQIDINWATKKVTMSLRREDSSVIETQVVNRVD
jgi:alkaline phosphatase D